MTSMCTIRSLFSVALAASLSLVGVSFVRAQEPASRAEELADAQKKKAQTLSPPQTGFVERKLLEVERAGGFGVARGVFVTFGDIKRGSGPSIGPAYGKTFDNGVVFETKAVLSLKRAKVAQVSIHSPKLLGERLRFKGRARWQDVPKVSFHGVSPGAPGRGATYAETMTEVSVGAIMQPAPLLRLDAGVGVERFETGIGANPGPEEAALFTGAPGVGADPRYVHSHASAALDSRDSDGYTRRGTLLRGTFHDYREQTSGPYSFQRVDGVAEQYIPVLRGNWVIYLGVRGSTTTSGAGDTVPYFLMPDLGGHDLRGYDNYRFRNRHSLMFTAEYRWYAQEFLDGAIFYDAGKAVSRRADLDFSGLKGSYGAGIRLHGPRTTMLRLEVARSREGTRLILAFSPVGG